MRINGNRMQINRQDATGDSDSDLPVSRAGGHIARQSLLSAQWCISKIDHSNASVAENKGECALKLKLLCKK